MPADETDASEVHSRIKYIGMLLRAVDLAPQVLELLRTADPNETSEHVASKLGDLLDYQEEDIQGLLYEGIHLFTPARAQRLREEIESLEAHVASLG